MRRPPVRVSRAPKSRARMRVKLYLTYPKKLLREPLVYWVSHKFDVMTNIRSASVSKEVGLVAIELDGLKSAVEGAIAWLREQGVTVEPIEKNIIE
jgi:ABC-type methionine transport system ATPase subunit